MKQPPCSCIRFCCERIKDYYVNVLYYKGLNLDFTQHRAVVLMEMGATNKDPSTQNEKKNKNIAFLIVI